MNILVRLPGFKTVVFAVTGTEYPSDIIKQIPDHIELQSIEKYKLFWPQGIVLDESKTLSENHVENKSILEFKLAPEFQSEEKVGLEAKVEHGFFPLSPQAQRVQSSDALSRYDEMLQWLQSGGLMLNSVEKVTEEMQPGRQYDLGGLRTTRGVNEGEVLVSVPEMYFISDALARRSEIGQKIVAADLSLRSSHTILAAFLLQEKYDPHSFWAPYLNLLRLPAEYRNMPIFFNAEELSYLKGSMAVDALERRAGALQAEYETLCLAVPEFCRFTHEEFVWARIVVITRIFGLRMGGAKVSVMVPMGDTLKHGRECSKWLFNEDTQAFEVVASRYLAPSEMLCVSYGIKCNSRFFVNYGFVLPENDANEAVFNFKLKVIKQSRQKDRVISEFQWPVPYAEGETMDVSHSIVFGFRNFPCRTFAALRCYLAESVELLDSESNTLPEQDTIHLDELGVHEEGGSFTYPISLENEYRVWCAIEEAAQQALQKFPTTIAEDEVLLNLDDLTTNIRNAILMRLGEKKVLARALEYATMFKKILPSDDIVEELGRLGKNNYFREYATALRDLHRDRLSHRTISQRFSWACSGDFIGFVSYLEKHCDWFLDEPKLLSIACTDGAINLVKYLIHRGAWINISYEEVNAAPEYEDEQEEEEEEDENKYGGPLEAAVENGNEEVIGFLLAHGADTSEVEMGSVNYDVIARGKALFTTRFLSQQTSLETETPLPADLIALILNYLHSPKVMQEYRERYLSVPAGF